METIEFTNMNGFAVFEYTNNGWRVVRFVSLAWVRFNKNIETKMGRLIVQGNFKEIPKAGKFCKRPHKLIWGNT